MLRLKACPTTALPFFFLIKKVNLHEPEDHPVEREEELQQREDRESCKQIEIVLPRSHQLSLSMRQMGKGYSQKSSDGFDFLSKIGS